MIHVTLNQTILYLKCLMLRAQCYLGRSCIQENTSGQLGAALGVLVLLPAAYVGNLTKSGRFALRPTLALSFCCLLENTMETYKSLGANDLLASDAWAAKKARPPVPPVEPQLPCLYVCFVCVWCPQPSDIVHSLLMFDVDGMYPLHDVSSAFGNVPQLQFSWTTAVDTAVAAVAVEGVVAFIPSAFGCSGM